MLLDTILRLGESAVQVRVDVKLKRFQDSLTTLMHVLALQLYLVSIKIQDTIVQVLNLLVVFHHLVD